MKISFKGQTHKIPATPTYFKNGAYVAGAPKKYLNSLEKGLGDQFENQRKKRDKQLNKQPWFKKGC